MRAFFLTLYCCFVAVSIAGSEPAPGIARHNVFLITIDTLRADHLHCYGYQKIQTPALDELASGGIRFAQAFTPSPITNTSHASILTGLLPSSHGVSDFGIALAGDHPTLAQTLEEKGYRTGAFIGAVILDSKSLAPGLDRGFQFYDNFPEHAAGKSRWGRIERRGMDVAQRTEKWFAAHPGGSHFVWMHLYDPHDPYQPPPPYSETYRERLYDGEIAYADAALGHLIDYLKKQNLYDDAVIVVVGDHGEGLGDHNEDTHGIFLYDSTTHVPLIVKLPKGRFAGKVVEAQVRTIDIMPTVLDLLGIVTRAKVDGESLKPFFSGDEATARIALAETQYPLRFGWAPLRSVRSGGFKFIEAPQPELYDLQSDPKELRNAYAPWDETVQKLRRTLADSMPQAVIPGKSSASTVSARTIDELHALGYLGPADAGSSTDAPEPSLLPDPKDKIQEQNLLHAAMIASEDERPVEARAALEKLMQLNGSSANGLLQLARLEMDSKNYGKAAQYLLRARELRPQDSIAALEHAEALEQIGDLQGARDAAQASLKLDSNQFLARLLLGRVYLGLNDAQGAQDQFEAATILQPGNLEAEMGLAKALIAENKLAEAAATLESAAKSAGNNSGVFELLAQVYTRTGQPAKAQEAEIRARAAKRAQVPAQPQSKN